MSQTKTATRRVPTLLYNNNKTTGLSIRSFFSWRPLLWRLVVVVVLLLAYSCSCCCSSTTNASKVAAAATATASPTQSAATSTKIVHSNENDKDNNSPHQHHHHHTHHTHPPPPPPPQPEEDTDPDTDEDEDEYSAAITSETCWDPAEPETLLCLLDSKPEVTTTTTTTTGSIPIHSLDSVQDLLDLFVSTPSPPPTPNHDDDHDDDESVLQNNHDTLLWTIFIYQTDCSASETMMESLLLAITITADAADAADAAADSSSSSELFMNGMGFGRIAFQEASTILKIEHAPAIVFMKRQTRSSGSTRSSSRSNEMKDNEDGRMEDEEEDTIKWNTNNENNHENENEKAEWNEAEHKQKTLEELSPPPPQPEEEEEEEDPEEEQQLWTVRYQGASQTAKELAEGLRHYWSRLLHSKIQYRKKRHVLRSAAAAADGNSSHNNNNNSDEQNERDDVYYLEALTISVSSMMELETLLQPSGPETASSSSSSSSLFPLFPSVNTTFLPPLDPLLSPQEQAKIRNVWEKTVIMPSSHWVVARCEQQQQQHHYSEEEIQTRNIGAPSFFSSTGFDELASVLVLHHQILFTIFPAETCPLFLSKTTTTTDDDDDERLWGNTTDCEMVSIYKVVENVLSEEDADSTNGKTFRRSLQHVHTLVGNAHQPKDAMDNLDAKTTQDHEEISSPFLNGSSMPPLPELLARLLRPHVLWWDRQATTPIAFAPYYRVHAVLVLDFHSTEELEEDPMLTQVLKEFGRLCQRYHWNETSIQKNSQPQHEDMVCLMVPSTETRVLTTFGIDIWSGIDERISRHVQWPQQQKQDGKGAETREQKHHDGPPVYGSTPSTALPLLFITNRTETLGVQRYYLDPPLLSPPGGGRDMAQFVRDFWAHRLEPELHSRATATPPKNVRPPRPPKNAHGVAEWTAYHHAFHLRAHQQILTYPGASASSSSNINNDHDNDDYYFPPPQTLLMIYAPTCGHSKRLSTAWNVLSRLVHDLDWDKWLQLARLDVTKEEFSAMGASLLPSVYYYFYDPSEGNNNDDRATTTNNNSSSSFPVWFDRREVGGLSDPLELVEWLLDVGVGLDEAALLEVLLVAERAETEWIENDDNGEENLPQHNGEGDPDAAKEAEQIHSIERVDDSSSATSTPPLRDERPFIVD